MVKKAWHVPLFPDGGSVAPNAKCYQLLRAIRRKKCFLNIGWVADHWSATHPIDAKCLYILYFSLPPKNIYILSSPVKLILSSALIPFAPNWWVGGSKLWLTS